MTTVVEDDQESRVTPEEDVRSPVDVVCDSGVFNGSLSENGGPTDNTDATTQAPTLSSDPTAAAEAPDVAPLKRISYLSLEERTGKGLSCLSLEVCASGDNINMLNRDDLSGCGSSVGSSVERELSSVEREPSPVAMGEEKEDRAEGRAASGREDLLKEDVGISLDSRRSSESVNPGEVIVRTSPSGSSRCSSSMGYLEPRPSQQPPTEHHMVSPKDVQKQLMEKVTILTTPSPDTASGGEREGREESETRSEIGMEKEATSLPTSRSSQSLDKAGTSNGVGRRMSLGNFFQRKKTVARSKDLSHQTMAASSTTGLILNQRPKTLPAKSEVEEKRHQQQHQQMMAAARKKELQKAREEVRKEKQRRDRDRAVADSIKEWEKILPKWDTLHSSRKVHDLWWAGLPPGIRGKVWRKAIGNDLNISSALYLINLKRCKERLASARERTDSNSSRKSVSREQSVEVIHLDLLRTFPTLGFFQEGGPYHRDLYDILGAYACYRPDIGYVQGMSFLAAVLLLNMDAPDAFICLANLLNLTSYLAFFKVDHALMLPYFRTFQVFFQDSLPRLSGHFNSLSFSPEFYLIEWIFTIYTRTLPLDVACRVWDMFCRDGDSFLFRTAIGILKQFREDLLSCRSLEELGQFLGNLPPVESDTLFLHIESVHFTAKKFRQVLSQEQKKPAFDSAPAIV